MSQKISDWSHDLVFENSPLMKDWTVDKSLARARSVLADPQPTKDINGIPADS